MGSLKEFMHKYRACTKSGHDKLGLAVIEGGKTLEQSIAENNARLKQQITTGISDIPSRIDYSSEGMDWIPRIRTISEVSADELSSSEANISNANIIFLNNKNQVK